MIRSTNIYIMRHSYLLLSTKWGGILVSISPYDQNNIEKILYGNQDWFGAHLLRLIARADPFTREQFRKGFPDYVEAFEKWERGDNQREIMY